MRRILIIAGIVVVIGLGLYFGRSYIFKFADPIEQTQEQITESNNEELPEADVQDDPRLTQLSDIELLEYWVDKSDRTAYGVSLDGKVYKIPAGGTSEELFALGSKNISAVYPAPVGNQAIVLSEYPSSPFFSIINPVTKGRLFLPLDTVSAAWSPDAKEVVYLKGQTLNIFTVANGRSRFITNLDMTDILLEWKVPREIYIGTRAGAGILGSWWTYNLDRKTLRSLTQELPSLIVAWSSDGKSGLEFSQKTPSRPAGLSLIHPDGSRIYLNTVTLPDKCTFEGNIIYCAEPKIANATDWPDSYYQNQRTADTIVRIDLSPYLDKLTLYSGEDTTQIDAYRPLKISSSLYFINRRDNKLYALSLQ